MIRRRLSLEQRYKKEVSERNHKIWFLRKIGYTYRSIGDQVGISGQAVRLCYRKTVRKIEYIKNPGPYGFLSVRAVNCLREAGIKSLTEARKLSELTLLKMRNCGPKTLQEIKYGG